MGFSQGPKINNNGLVFGYDADDKSCRYYKGMPATNLIPYISPNHGTINDTYFKTSSGTEEVNIPEIGLTTVYYCNIFNDYIGGSGNCCPSPFSYGSITANPNTQYTYQIIFRTSTGYYSGNYMYHYQFNGGTMITQYGLLSGSRITDLGDGWKHGWGTFTTESATNTFHLALFHYEYGTYNKIQVAKVMLTQGNITLPPRQFIPVNTTRSSTSSLIDLKRSVAIDLSNVSFDSNAHPIFDGTNDYISIPTYPAIEIVDNITVEAVYMRLTTDPVIDVIAQKYGDGWKFLHSTSGQIGFCGRNGDGTYYVNYTPDSISNNVYHHIVGIKTGLFWKIYVDGILKNTTTANSIGSLVTSNPLEIGREGNAYYPNMKLPIFKIYNKALTDSEILENFNAYKYRFNM